MKIITDEAQKMIANTIYKIFNKYSIDDDKKLILANSAIDYINEYYPENKIEHLEYKNDEYSRTDDYFAKMGLTVRYFKPENGSAPLAFYFAGDLLADYTDFELISAISTMESFQKIYRPEIYNTNSPAGVVYQPSLSYQDFSLTQIVYDRVERGELAVKQGKWTEEHFIKPYQAILNEWAANFCIETAKQRKVA